MMPPTYVRSFGEEIFLKMEIIILSETEKRRKVALKVPEYSH